MSFFGWRIVCSSCSRGLASATGAKMEARMASADLPTAGCSSGAVRGSGEGRRRPIKMGPEETALGAGGAAVASTGAFAGEALGDRRHVDMGPDLRLGRKATTDQPAHEDLSRPPRERQPAARLDRAGRLAN